MTGGTEGSSGRPRRSRRLLVIHNPVAGRRRARRFRAVLERLARDGGDIVLRPTAAAGDAAALAGQVRPGEVDLVVAAGGDGTVNEAINGLLAAGRPAPAPLAVVPLGTSNVLAGEIGLGTAPEAVARAIREGVVRRVSLGWISGERILGGRIAGSGIAGGGPAPAGGRYFILMAGAGLDGHAVAGVDPALKRRFAQAAYVLSGLRQAMNPRRRRYAVDIDGARHDAAWVVVAKASRYGGPFVMAARARLDDPRFEVCLFAEGGLWPAARQGAALALGRIARTRGFHSVMGRRVRIAAAPAAPGDGPAAEPLQADGEDVARLPVEIDVAPDALDLVVPRGGPYG